MKCLLTTPSLLSRASQEVTERMVGGPPKRGFDASKVEQRGGLARSIKIERGVVWV
jgi:hypothetical protein